MSLLARVSIIIPTHNGAATLAACLDALQAASIAPYEIIVVDDASTDASAAIAERRGARVLRVNENIGAARAKNAGAAAATGAILFFTDDDVIISPDALARVADCLRDARVAGVVGLLSAQIPFRDFASQYKNFWMRFSYERLPRERIGVFYTSIAAIRREIFHSLGGFDENYRGASIAEDTEFGQRAWAAGHNILLDPRIAGVHHKRYSLAQVLQTDFRRARALTLMRLRKWGQPFFTSVPVFYQLAVPLTFVTLALFIGAVIFNNLILLLLAALFALDFYVINSVWFIYLARERGIGMALRAALFQPLDVVAVGAGMLAAGVEFVRGTRY